MSLPKLIILLSSYNGEQYIQKQIESIMNQSYQNFTLLIRDDGSSDSTRKIINKLSKNNKKIISSYGENIGVVKSFLELLKIAPSDNNYVYLFCDQDDIWLPKKLQMTTNHFNNSKNPSKTLYCSRLKYVDKNLNNLGLSQSPKHIGFNNAVVENIATGCTMAFGHFIRERLLAADPDKMIMHDWWAYLIACTFGEVIYDSTPTVLYRQHSNTVTPWEPGSVKIRARFKGFVNRVTSNTHQGLQSLNQAIDFIQTYSDTPEKYISIVNRLVVLRKRNQLFNRFKYILNPDVVRTNKIEDWSLKPMILFGWH